MMTDSRMWPCVLSVLLVIVFLWYGLSYNLFLPYILHSDVDFYYVLGAASVFEADQLPRFNHPGINVMLGVAWLQAWLSQFPAVPNAGISHLAASENPARTLLEMVNVGKLFNTIMGGIYLWLVYRISQISLNNRLASCVVVAYFFLTVGVLELMFSVRPELLSAVCLLGVMYLYSKIRAIQGIRTLAVVMFLLGLLLSSATLAKVQTVVFVPLALIPLVNYLRQDIPYTEKGYVYLLGIGALGVAVLGAPWLAMLNIEIVTQFLSEERADLDRYLQQLIRYHGIARIAVLGLCGAMGVIVTAGFVGRLWPVKRRRLRIGIAASLFFWVGILCSLDVFFINDSSLPMEGGMRVVATALAETVYVNFLQRLYVERNVLLDGLLLNNHEVRYVVTHMTALFVLIGIAVFFGNRKERWALAGILSAIWALANYSALRGGAGYTYYYQVYMQIVALFGIIFAAAVVPWHSLRRKQAIVIAVCLVVALTSDVLRAYKDRGVRFSHVQPTVGIVSMISYYNRAYAYEDILRPRYCAPESAQRECFNDIGKAIEAEQQGYFAKLPSFARRHRPAER